MDTHTTDPVDASFRGVRRWCIERADTVTPSDLMRQFRFGYSHAASTLEELERDRVVRLVSPGVYTSRYESEMERANACRPAKRVSAQLGRVNRPSAARVPRKHHDPNERCEVCGWSIHPDLRKRRVGSGCHAHHIVPVSCDGDTEPLNLIILCPNHHAMTHSLFPVTGRVYRGPRTRDGLVEALRLADQDPVLYTLERAREAVRRKEEGTRRHAAHTHSSSGGLSGTSGPPSPDPD